MSGSAQPLAPTDRWLVVRKGGARRGAGGDAPASSLSDAVAPEPSGPLSLRQPGAGPVVGPTCDPWADVQAAAKAKGPAVAVAAEDWEDAQVEAQLLGGKPAPLEALREDPNMWLALGGEEEERLQPAEAEAEANTGAEAEVGAEAGEEADAVAEVRAELEG